MLVDGPYHWTEPKKIPCNTFTLSLKPGLLAIAKSAQMAEFTLLTRACQIAPDKKV